MKIVVTKEDIKLGVPCSSEACPIVTAIKRRLPTYRVRVERYRIVIGNQKYAMPDIASDFIDKFDDDKPVQPISFELVAGLEETP